MGTPSAKEVKGWLSALEREIDDVNRRLEPLLKEREKLMEQREIVARLLDTLVDGGGTKGKMPRKAKQFGSTGVYVIERTIELLEEEGGPLHINELHARFLQKGYEVPGSGEAVNITSHIRKSPEIISTGRGIYDLKKRHK